MITYYITKFFNGNTKNFYIVTNLNLYESYRVEFITNSLHCAEEAIQLLNDD